MKGNKMEMGVNMSTTYPTLMKMIPCMAQRITPTILVLVTVMTRI